MGGSVYDGFYDNNVKERRSLICLFYSCHRILVDSTPCALDSVKSLSNILTCLPLASYVLIFVCFASNIIGLTSESALIDLVCS